MQLENQDVDRQTAYRAYMASRRLKKENVWVAKVDVASKSYWIGQIDKRSFFCCPASKFVVKQDMLDYMNEKLKLQPFEG